MAKSCAWVSPLARWLPAVLTEVADWRPRAGPDIARLRAGMLDRARRFFRSRGVLEVDTPVLSCAAVSDPHIESIAVSLSLERHRAYYLHTSPEYCMKRLLCAGYPDIFQISKVFRDNEAGRYHQPEFTLIEWYRLKFDLDGMISDTLEFIANILQDDGLRAGALQLSYRDAFLQFADCDPFTSDIATLSALAGADAALQAALGDDRDAWLDLLLADKVVPQFAADKLTVLSHYPLSQAALARACPANPHTADRFEVFLGQHELANGYVELTDTDEQMRRFSHDQALRKTRGQAQRPLDHALLAAIEQGLPQCAGVAAGLDRLLMIHTGSDDIREVQTFAFVEDQ